MFFKNDCKSVNLYISAILDGELKDKKANKIRNHIESCDRCRSELEIVKSIKPLVKNKIKIEKAPFYLKTRIIGSIEELDKEKSLIGRIFPIAWRPVYTTSVVAMLFLLVIIPLYYLSSSVSASPIIAKSVKNHMSNTITDIFDEQNPSNGTELERKFDVPGLSWQGIGSPKVTLHYLKERRVAYISFSRKGHKLSVFIFDINNLKLPEGRIIKQGDKEIFVDTFNGYNVLFWREGNTGYSMVSDLAGDEMLFFLKYGEGYVNQIQKNIEIGTFFEE
ncbi:MAG: hypothetical protein A2Z59_11340 [Nitrospinae bacterium RIFCSPLOWO2_02_39_17]|nr:MAG: hypothetical protein A2W53_03260 [Nitrospinae bacterium RIFCSPHIGHO2_02_39_11]OGV99508.1 MAG: hypothetical protein A3D97_00645 [Nitrospinae bacterium RIFCSPHIGHO2_12_FULL_39_42]OGW05577.1 MAG: hypothetical protein A2Z59_11340 [Nitrospinae bacterium RIFCSPLOWO2_02_39_17]OGW08293.1 MAG: hypothetical protein A2W75_09890 [Nitrospinae bacterium RIFCSPLOWO2_12_39_15]